MISLLLGQYGEDRLSANNSKRGSGIQLWFWAESPRLNLLIIIHTVEEAESGERP